MLRSLEKYLVFLLLFLLPTQLAFHFWPNWAFVFGIRVDFLSPAVYVTDIFACLLILSNIKIYRKYFKYILGLLIFAAINTHFSTSPPESLYRWLKIFEMVGIGIYFAKGKVDSEKIRTTLFYSALTISVIGIVQFLTGRSIGGLLYLFGERTFSMSTPGIALVKISGQDFLRAYATFSHPNSLAGFLGLVLIILLDKPQKDSLGVAGLLIIFICFILTFSLAASLSLVVVLVYKYFLHKKKSYKIFGFAILCVSFLGSLVLPIFSKTLFPVGLQYGQSVSQRLDLTFLAGKMISERFLIGEGLNTFIVNLPKFKGVYSYAWLLQPVHNVPLLTLSETGIVGLLIVFALLVRSFDNSYKQMNPSILFALLFVAITWTLDHYWFTLQQNILLLSIVIGLANRPIKLRSK